MEEDRYDRFVSEMTVHKTFEDAQASIKERRMFMERMRQERRKRKSRGDNTIFGHSTCPKCGEKTAMHPGYSGCSLDECPLYFKEFRDSIKNVP